MTERVMDLQVCPMHGVLSCHFVTEQTRWPLSFDISIIRERVIIIVIYLRAIIPRREWLLSLSLASSCYAHLIMGHGWGHANSLLTPYFLCTHTGKANPRCCRGCLAVVDVLLPRPFQACLKQVQA